MKFSVILPSLLSDYPGAATGRDQKLIRAIRSVLDQTFQDFELIIVADGCKLTEYIVRNMARKEELPRKPEVVLLSVDRKELWSNNARNAGIEAAAGEYILYIDSDDRWAIEHLEMISEQLHGEDWVCFNDYAITEDGFKERDCDVSQYGRCGTSNICHTRRLNLLWEKTGYGHDFHFIQQLRKFKNSKKIFTPGYYVCHIGNVSV